MNGNSGNNPVVARGLECVAVGILSASFFGLLTMRLGVFNAPLVWLCAACSVFVYYRLAAQRFAGPFFTPTFWQIALVVGVGLLFRVPPYLNMLGGTDDSVYVNMGMHLARTGGVMPIDHIFERLKDPALQQLYKSTSYLSDQTYLPGIYSTDDGLVFQFYHLFPVWIALFGSAGGPQVAVCAQTFLSLISLIYFQSLACILTGKRSLGLLAGLLLAINPLHAYISKLTVSEMTLLAHTLISFYFLAVYCRSGENGSVASKWPMWISVLALGMGFMTRVTGFLYLPFLVTVFLGAIIFDDNPDRRKGLLFWAGTSMVLCLLGIGYGLTWSSPYASAIFRISFEQLFGAYWLTVLQVSGLAALAMLAGGWMLVSWVRRWGRTEVLRRRVLAAIRLLPYAMLLMAILALYRAYQVGFTDAYANDSWVRAISSVHGWRAFCVASLPLAALYLSPFVTAVFAIAVFRRDLPLAQMALLIFVAFFFFNSSVAFWYLGNYPAMHRHILPELVPGMLLFAVCALDGLPRLSRKLAVVLMALGSFWCVGLSMAQWGKKENEGAEKTFDEIARTVNSGDILLVSTEKVRPLELQVPLNYIYGLNTARINEGNLRNAGYLFALRTSFAKVYLLSDKNSPPEGFERVDDIPFIVRTFAEGDYPPRTGVTRYDLSLTLYRQVSP